MVVFANHKTVSLDELKKGGAKDIVVPKAPLKMCEEHDEQMKIYCHDCSCLICRDCIIENHNGHKHEFVKKAAPKVSKELLEQLNPLKEVGVKLSHAMEEIKTIKDEVKAQVDTVSKKIKTSFNELRQILANREQELLKEATAKGEQKLGLLSNQEKKLSTSSAVVQSVIEYTKQCLDHATNEDIMSMRADIQSKIKRELTQLESEDLYEPVEVADITLEVECAEDLKQICLTKAKLTQLVLEYSVTGAGIEEVNVNKLAEFYVTAKVPGQKQSERIANLECHLYQPIQQQGFGDHEHEVEVADTEDFQRGSWGRGPRQALDDVFVGDYPYEGHYEEHYEKHYEKQGAKCEVDLIKNKGVFVEYRPRAISY